MFFTIWGFFWNISRIYFFFFSVETIKSNCYVIFLNVFPVICLWWIVYSFVKIFICKAVNFCYFLWIFFYFLVINGTVTAYWRHLLSFFVIFLIYSCCFVFLPNQGNLYMIHHNLDFFHDIYHTTIEQSQR